MTRPVQVGVADYRDKVYACWLGKNIGGTLGAPYEGQKYTHALTYYDPLPDESAPNDDLDLQLVWLVMLEREGLPPRLPHFARYWRDYLHRYPWNEYGFCNRNLARGLMPPVSGWFENYYVDEMGSPIRSELWACVAPGDPQTAAALSWMDSAMDHAGGEGTYGEMFWAAVESAAFLLDDPLQLIRIGLAVIPPGCNISRAIREAVWCWQNGLAWGDARERIYRLYGSEQPCNAIPNHGFTIIGWLYGQGYGDQLCKAVNCGYDTDCTGATLGSLLGILGGTAAIPAAWSDPIGTDIILHPYTIDCGVPKTLDELTDRTAALAEAFAGRSGSGVSFGARRRVPRDLVGLLQRSGAARAALAQDVRAAAELDGEIEIRLHYNGDPVLYAGEARIIEVTCRLRGEPVSAQVELGLPEGWRATPVEGSAPAGFDIVAPTMDAPQKILVRVLVGDRLAEAAFVVLSPNEAQGYPNAIQSTAWRPGMKVHCHSPRHPGLRLE